jgi:hypothetical protein
LNFIKVNDYFYISLDNIDAIEKQDELNTILYMKRDTYLGLKQVSITMPFSMVLDILNKNEVNVGLANTFLKNSGVPAW